jgi:hypothetical protein
VHVVGRKRQLLSGIARCGKCGGPLYHQAPYAGKREATYRCVAGQDTSAPRRAELLQEICRAQEKRAEARQDWAEDVIDKDVAGKSRKTVSHPGDMPSSMHPVKIRTHAGQ